MRPHSALWAFIAFMLLFLTAMPTVAQVPQQINFQGMLTDADGSPVADGDYAMTFAIYDAASGGTQFWVESQTVSVAGGVYNVVLGQPGNAIDPADMDGQRYLGVRVGGDLEMTPRQPITSTAFSLRSAVSDDADTLDGLDATDFATDAHAHGFSDLSGMASDAQIPDTITVNYAGNADTLDGSHADAFALVAHTHSATNITSGTLSTSRYSAYSDLGAEGYLGDASGDVARNNGTRQVNLNADLLDGHDTADFAMAATVTSLQAQVSALQGQVDTLVALLADVSRPDGNTIRFSDVNLQIVNGTGSTAGTGNGRGNLIVGYNENTVSASRTGSHNLVVGIDHEYTSYAGLLAGRRNRISGSSSSVMGYGNGVTANYGSVSGGYENTVSSIYSSASGGRGNTVNAAYASISGGRDNLVSGNYASISGGYHNVASGEYAFVGGGGGPIAPDGNIAVAHYSAILGGLNNLTGDGSRDFDIILLRDVLTGGSDHTLGLQATVSGGTANMASGEGSSVSGGSVNSASGLYSSVSGGRHGEADGLGSSTSGGFDNTASGEHASISGGRSNTASGDYASVSGGMSNTASGNSSSVSGGLGDEVSGPFDWRAGDDFFAED